MSSTTSLQHRQVRSQLYRFLLRLRNLNNSNKRLKRISLKKTNTNTIIRCNHNKQPKNQHRTSLLKSRHSHRMVSIIHFTIRENKCRNKKMSSQWARLSHCSGVVEEVRHRQMLHSHLRLPRELQVWRAWKPCLNLPIVQVDSLMMMRNSFKTTRLMSVRHHTVLTPKSSPNKWLMDPTRLNKCLYSLKHSQLSHPTPALMPIVTRIATMRACKSKPVFSLKTKF